MNTITKFVVLGLLYLVVGNINAQDNNQSKIESLNDIKEIIQKEEREFLKNEVETINQRLENGEITKEDAEKLKQEAAQKRALNIENRIAIIDNRIELLKRNPEGYETSEAEGAIFGLSFGGENDDFRGFKIYGDKKHKYRKYDKRTTSDLVFAIGFNNAIIEGESLNDSPYKLGGSGFVELGWAWKTRVLQNSNAVRFKYGFSFQWNKLDIKDNLYFNEVNNVVTLEEYPLNLNKSKFRTTNLVFPVHFEFGPSKKIDRDTYFRYSTHNQFKIGIGAYGGFMLQSMQKLKYKEDGHRQKDKFKSYNTNDLVYGVSSYLAWGDVGLYFKYDLSPIFKNQAYDQNNISLGIRFDMD